MKEINLTQEKVALVDDEDYEWLNQFKWHAILVRNTFYAARNIRIGYKKGSKELMHVAIMKPKYPLEVDHIDHNGLNNQRYNLRNALHIHNLQNSTVRSTSKCKYLGVSKNRTTFRSRITINGKQLVIGYFKTEEEAALAYDKKAKELFGEFANLNFKGVSQVGTLFDTI